MIDPNDYICKYCIGRTHQLGQAILLDMKDNLICPNCNRVMVLKVIKDKPPIGLRPKHIHDMGRAIELLSAMQRYTDQGLRIPDRWLKEFQYLDIYESREV